MTIEFLELDNFLKIFFSPVIIYPAKTTRTNH
jgi:hypothetical protein